MTDEKYLLVSVYRPKYDDVVGDYQPIAIVNDFNAWFRQNAEFVRSLIRRYECYYEVWKYDSESNRFVSLLEWHSIEGYLSMLERKDGSDYE